MNYVRNVHEYLGHETDPWVIARRLNLEVVPGEFSGLCGMVITLAREDYYSRRAPGILRHELAHHLLVLSGCEDQLLRLAGSYEDGLPTIENLCYHAALILQIPEPLLKRAQAECGNTPQALVRLAALAEVSVVDALYRWVYAEVGAQRAAWIIRGKTVVEVARSGDWLPFWFRSEVDDPCEELPNALLYALEGHDTLGVISW